MRVISDIQWNSIIKFKEEVLNVLSNEQQEAISNSITDICNIISPEINKTTENKRLSPKIFPIVKDFNYTVGPNILPSDDALFFGNEKVIHLGKADIFDLLVFSGIFMSKNEARKNWKGIKELPSGYSEIGPVGKSKVMIFCLNAI